MVNPPKPGLLDQVLGSKSVFDSCGRKLRSSGKRVAHGVSRGFGYLRIGAAKRRKKVLLDPALSSLTGLLARAHGSPRLTPWATSLRHSVADISRCGCPNSDLRHRCGNGCGSTSTR